MQPVRIYVRQDENGVLRVGDTRVMLDSVIAAFHLGHSAETIAQQYPALSLEEVYGAITYYLANQADVRPVPAQPGRGQETMARESPRRREPRCPAAARLGRPDEDECAMSRPRFLADHDLNEHIVSGVLRQEPLIDFFARPRPRNEFAARHRNPRICRMRGVARCVP